MAEGGENADVLDIQALPDEAILKIFSFLPTLDLCRARTMCSRWKIISQNKTLWDNVDSHPRQLSASQMSALFRSLPKCVRYLSVCGDAPRHHVPDILEFRKKFPILRVLIMENVDIPGEFDTNECIKFTDLPKSVTVISLRRSNFNIDGMIEFSDVDSDTSSSQASADPNVVKITLDLKVLDMSMCTCIPEKLDMLKRFSDLNEIYMAGCPITSDQLKSLIANVPCVRVLDLENTLFDNAMFPILEQEAKELEELYIGWTKLTDEACFKVIEGESFRCLSKICTKGTSVTHCGLNDLVENLPTIKYLNGFSWKVVVTTYLTGEGLPKEKTSTRCDHFLQSHQCSNV